MTRICSALILFILPAALFNACEKQPDPEKNEGVITDRAFLDILIEKGIDTDGDGVISELEAEAVKQLIIYGDYNPWDPWDPEAIHGLKGIESFVNLEHLTLTSHQISEMDFSRNASLKYLDCQGNGLDSLNISNCKALQLLWCGTNQLTHLDLSDNEQLEFLICNGNELTTLNTANNLILKELSCENNLLTGLDVSHLEYLETLECGRNFLTGLDVSNNRELKALMASNYCCWPNESNQFDELDVSLNLKLQYLGACYMGLTELDVSANTQLLSLGCRGNFLSSLDLSSNRALQALNCSSNPLTKLDLSQNIALGSDIPYYCPYGIEIFDMPSLQEVCVWTLPFPPEGVYVDTTGSPNVYFTNECSK